MFDSKFISPSVQSQLPKEYKLRPLALSDFKLGYLQVLQQLTTIGNVDQQKFEDQYHRLQNSNNAYFPMVIEKDNKIVAAGTLIIEHKFIHDCGCVGHIEDIVVDEQERGKKLGLRILDALTFIGQSIGCYKIILNCTESNIPFYEKCGFEKKEVEMVKYFK